MVCFTANGVPSASCDSTYLCNSFYNSRRCMFYCGYISCWRRRCNCNNPCSIPVVVFSTVNVSPSAVGDQGVLCNSFQHSCRTLFFCQRVSVSYWPRRRDCAILFTNLVASLPLLGVTTGIWHLIIFSIIMFAFVGHCMVFLSIVISLVSHTQHTHVFLTVLIGTFTHLLIASMVLIPQSWGRRQTHHSSNGSERPVLWRGWALCASFAYHRLHLRISCLSVVHHGGHATLNHVANFYSRARHVRTVRVMCVLPFHHQPFNQSTIPLYINRNASSLRKTKRIEKRKQQQQQQRQQQHQQQ